ncbi:Fungal lipase-like domain-containing protein [Hirschfeldia incana]|nr:Fungal lipase-like domain-containing protein [Hirschfeldia incana]
MDSYSLNCTEVGKLVLSSGLLERSWSKISEINESVQESNDLAIEIKVYREATFIFVVFYAPPVCGDASLNSGSTLVSDVTSQDADMFSFLCSEKTPSFYLHTHALQLFASAVTENNRLIDLKSKLLESKKPVIITGAALGGSLASLFTLWLLEKVEPKLKRPLCITFGSPFIGDAKLQQILENSVRNSCFLHVADATQTLTTKGFEPFGTYLICNDSACVCIDDPKAVIELLIGGNADLEGGRDYGNFLKSLDRSSMVDARLMIGDVIINGMKKRAEKKKNQRFDQLKKLNKIKISMAYMEWYKKESKKAKIVYYDQFKNKPAFVYETCRKEMNDYWETMVQEVEKVPQGEASYLKKRCLLSGNNYRRLMEPLDIAKYYLEGEKEYRTRGRARHYVMLEKWFKESELNEQLRGEGTDLSELLTFDSCFWSEVEEALIAINELKTQPEEGSVGKLMKFEEYVWDKISKREVSPEIFLEKSSFMTWWKEYKEIKGTRDWFGSSPSEFTEFMNTGEYKSYGKPELNSSG